jgi:hypothetical protein
MIRIELRDAKNHVLMTKDFWQETIVIGRALDCDFIVPDLEIKKTELTLVANELKELQKTISIGNHHLRITNLALYALAEPTSAQNFSWGWIRVRELRGLWTVMGLILFLLIVEQVFLSVANVEVYKIFENLLALFVGPLVIATLLSVLSRALHGEYRVLRLYEWSLWSLLGFAVVSQDLYNVRWLLPDIFKYKEIYSVFFVLWLALVIWSFLALVFEQLSRQIRGLIVVLILLPIIVVRSFEYIPSRKKHRMLQPQTSPPRIELIESRPMDTETFLKTL